MKSVILLSAILASFWFLGEITYAFIVIGVFSYMFGTQHR